MIWLVAVLLVGTVFTLLGPSPRRRLSRLQPIQPATPAPQTWRHGVWLGVPAAGVVGLFGWGTAGLASGLAIGALSATGWGLWWQHRRRRAADRRAAAVVDACRMLAGLLRVGHVPGLALRLAGADAPLLAEAVSAQQIGASIPAALRRLSVQPGAQGLHDLAAAWEVAERTGASLTTTLDALTERLSAQQKVAQTVAAELSAPRASGRVLAVLPFAGLALGYVIGGDPMQFLWGTPLGQVCLVVGVGLACAGVWWIERLAVVTR